MKLIQCLSCGALDLMQENKCSFCNVFFDDTLQYLYVESTNLVDPKLVPILVNVISKRPKMIGRVYLSDLAALGYSLDQKRVNRCLYYNPEVFQSNLNANKVPAWTLEIKEGNINKSGISSNRQEYIPVIISAFDESNEDESSNLEKTVRFVPVKADNEFYQDYQRKIDLLDAIFLEWIEKYSLVESYLADLVQKKYSSIPKIDSSLSSFQKSFELGSYKLQNCNAKFNYIRDKIKSMPLGMNTLIIYSGIEASSNIIKTCSQNCSFQMFTKIKTQEDANWVHIGEKIPSVKLIDTTGIPFLKRGLVIEQCIFVGTAGILSDLNIVIKSLRRSTITKPIVEVLYIERTIEDPKYGGYKTFSEYDVYNRNLSAISSLRDLTPKSIVDQTNIMDKKTLHEYANQIEKNEFFCEAQPDNSMLDDIEIPNYNRLIDVENANIKNPQRNSRTNSLLPADMDLAVVKIFGKSNLHQAEIDNIASELGLNPTQIIYDNSLDFTLLNLVDLCNGHVSDIIIGPMYDRKGIRIETKIIETIKRDPISYPNLVLVGKSEPKINGKLIKEALIRTLKSQYIFKSGLFGDKGRTN